MEVGGWWEESGKWWVVGGVYLERSGEGAGLLAAHLLPGRNQAGACRLELGVGEIRVGIHLGVPATRGSRGSESLNWRQCGSLRVRIGYQRALYIYP